MREVVTVQLGGYANYVGAHTWNLRDEDLAAPDEGLDARVFFRQASARGARAPYAPRLQVVDACGAFGSLSVHTGAVRKPPARGVRPHVPAAAADPLWGGGVGTYRRPAPPLSRYLAALLHEEEAGGGDGVDEGADGGSHQDGDASARDDGAAPDYGLDAGVRYWTDYLKAPLHARTCHELRGVHAGSTPFDTYSCGAGAATSQVLDELYGGLRFFVEECDALGGLTLLVDSFSGWSAVGARYLEHIRDELGERTPVLALGASAYPAPAPGARARADAARANEALLVDALARLRATYVPLRAHAAARLPHARADPRNPFQTAAVLACGVQLAQAPLCSGGGGLGGMLAALRPCPSAMLSGVAVCMPALGPVSWRASAMEELRGALRLSGVDAAGARVPTGGEAAERPARPCVELVSTRGVAGEFEAFCRVAGKLALPVAFPRFFDARMDLHGRMGKGGAGAPATNEVAEISALCSVYTDGAPAQASFDAFATLLRGAARRNPDWTEPAMLLEASEDMTAIGCDYAALGTPQ